MPYKLAVVGAGNVGTCLALRLKEKGFKVVGVCCRTEQSSRRASEILDCRYDLVPSRVTREAEIVFITTPDRSIEETCRRLAEGGGVLPGQVVLHTSGAHSSAILKSARERGAAVLSLHPLQTFPSVEAGVGNIAGSYFTLEGDIQAVQVGKALVEALQGHPLFIPTAMKPLYHAAACVACNYFVEIVDLALRMMEKAGVSRSDALPALMPLLEGTLANLKKVGSPQALTGPIDRGDSLTVSAHLEILERIAPEITGLYCLLGRHTAEVARDKGTLDPDSYQQLLEIFRQAVAGRND